MKVIKHLCLVLMIEDICNDGINALPYGHKDTPK